MSEVLGSADTLPASSPSGAREEEQQALAKVGHVFGGRWTATSLLGVGGMASVYAARHRNGRLAALKVLHPAVALSQAARRRFLSEGYAANKVGHPGAVLVLDDGEDSDAVFLVMELLVGRTLDARLAAEGPLVPTEVARIAAAVLEVLAAAHDRGVVHRDIKPSNLFELEDGQVKVLDFGVARVREAGAPILTESGVTLGTPAFMAPEQAAGVSDEIDALTDLWAVGATMFRLLTGQLVHDARTPNAAVVASATKPAPRIRTVQPDVPLELAAVVDRALAFRRDDRFPNARAMRAALQRCTGRAPDFVSEADTASFSEAVEVPRVARPVRKRRSGLLVGILFAAGLGLVLLVRSLSSRGDAASTNRPSLVRGEPTSAAAKEPEATAAVSRELATRVPAPSPSPVLGSSSAEVQRASPPRVRRTAKQPLARDEDDTLIETRQ